MRQGHPPSSASSPPSISPFFQRSLPSSKLYSSSIRRFNFALQVLVAYYLPSRFLERYSFALLPFFSIASGFSFSVFSRIHSCSLRFESYIIGTNIHPCSCSISQSYPGKNSGRFPRAEKGRLSLWRDLWRPLAQLAAAMSRSVVNILADS